MFRKLLSLFFICIFVIAAYIYKRSVKTPSIIRPYPYIVTKNSFPGKDKALKADVLIIGDKQAEALGPFLPEIISSLSLNLKRPLTIYNWARHKEGLHRTFAKLKSLEKIPNVVIYMGSSEEYTEEKFLTRDENKLTQNIEIYEDDKLSSVIVSFPYLSKFIYKRYSKYFFLDEYRPDNKIRKGKTQQVYNGMNYRLFEYQFDELVDLLKGRGITLINITTPINLLIAPKKSCANTETNSVLLEQTKIRILLNRQQTKIAFKQATELSKSTIANAMSHYLKGRSALALRKLQIAKKELHLAAVYDCQNWRGNAVFNNIIRKKSSQFDLNIIDFDFLVNSFLGRETLFLNDIFVQNIFYKKLQRILIIELKKILEL